MGRYKQSQGTIILVTPFNDELQRYLMYELENARQWNKDMIRGGIVGMRKWSYRLVVKGKLLWEVNWTGNEIIAHSAESRIHIRKGLYIDMGNGKLVIEAS